jgi:hypothetical protein
VVTLLREDLASQFTQIVVVFNDHDVQLGNHSSNRMWLVSGA